ncbi:DUF1707 SHOCT-like domain-containing protein [Micromonosporaceae bacterium Da 78-11]
MAGEGMRVGDRERQTVADQLKSALDEGRLDLGEYDERIQKTYAARTYGDLDGLLDDLPGTVPVQRSQVRPRPEPTNAPATRHPAAAQVARWVGPYGGVVAVCVIIWAITSVSAGHLTYFWPVWMLIPVVLGIAGQWRNHGR